MLEVQSHRVPEIYQRELQVLPVLRELELQRVYNREVLSQRPGVQRSQPHDCAHSDGPRQARLPAPKSARLVHPRGRVWVGGRAGHLFAPFGRRRPFVQALLRLENGRQIYRDKIFVPAVRHAPLVASDWQTKILSQRPRLVDKGFERHRNTVHLTQVQLKRMSVRAV